MYRASPCLSIRIHWIPNLASKFARIPILVPDHTGCDSSITAVGNQRQPYRYRSRSRVYVHLSSPPAQMAVCIWLPLALILLCAYLARSFSIPSRLGFGLGEAGGPTLPDLYEASVPELQAGLDAGHFSSVDLVKVCLPTHLSPIRTGIH